MANKSIKRDENKPFDYFSEVKAAQKQEKPDATGITSRLRPDMVPASDTRPAAESVVKRDTLKTLLGIMLGLLLLGFIYYMFLGPGRPNLENSLASLAVKTDTPTIEITPTLVTITELPPSPTSPPIATRTASPTHTPTIRPTFTPVIAFAASPTRQAPTMSPTEVGCRDALTITLADVGKTLCVKGIVIKTIDSPRGFMVVFSTESGAFYWVSYDLIWSSARLNHCYQVTGKIEQIAINPILVFNYDNIPEACP